VAIGFLIVLLEDIVCKYFVENGELIVTRARIDANKYE